MSLAETLSWPFFNDGHRDFAARLNRAGLRRICTSCRMMTSTRPVALA